MSNSWRTLSSLHKSTTAAATKAVVISRKFGDYVDNYANYNKRARSYDGGGGDASSSSSSGDDDDDNDDDDDVCSIITLNS